MVETLRWKPSIQGVLLEELCWTSFVGRVLVGKIC